MLCAPWWTATGARFDDAFAAIDASYAEDVTDEFVVPCVLGDYAGMRDGDALLFANFRADRAREISTALLDKSFDGFKRERVVGLQRRGGPDRIFRGPEAADGARSSRRKMCARPWAKWWPNIT